MPISTGKSRTFVTFDVDWSPDWMIEDVCRILDSHDAPSTWFVTHDSPAIRKLRLRADRVELGIHPNCLPGSTHGRSEREALAHVKRIVPEAVSMRTHGLYQTTAFLLLAAAEFGIRLDSSIFMPIFDAMPFDLRVENIHMTRIAFFWADDLTMRDPHGSWQLPDGLQDPGTRVFAFHPFHIALNTTDYSLYERLKKECPLPQWSESFVAAHRNPGDGPRTFLEKLVRASGTTAARLCDLIADRAYA
jgi:hypothetical protein